ncbi:MAG: hypothetical protein ACPGAA_01740 [Flavobacteriaceae bacterium]
MTKISTAVLATNRKKEGSNPVSRSRIPALSDSAMTAIGVLG